MNSTSFINNPPSFLEVMALMFLIQKNFSKKGEQIYQFSPKNKTIERNLDVINFACYFLLDMKVI